MPVKHAGQTWLQALKLVKAKQEELQLENRVADAICQRLHIKGCGKDRGLQYGLLDE